MRHRGPVFVFNVVGLTAAAGLVLVALSTTEAEARACYSRLPSAAERTGHWSYSVKRGRKCWSGPLKKAQRLRLLTGRAFVTRRARVALSRRQSGASRSPTRRTRGRR